MMPLHLTQNDLRELRRYPEMVDQILDASTASNKRLELDLGPFGYDDPFALLEAVLFARTVGVTLVSLPEVTSAV